MWSLTPTWRRQYQCKRHHTASKRPARRSGFDDMPFKLSEMEDQGNKSTPNANSFTLQQQWIDDFQSFFYLRCIITSSGYSKEDVETVLLLPGMPTRRSVQSSFELPTYLEAYEVKSIALPIWMWILKCRSLRSPSNPSFHQPYPKYVQFSEKYICILSKFVKEEYPIFSFRNWIFYTIHLDKFVYR